MDITDRKIAEDLVQQSREWYRTMAEDIPLLLCRFDPAFNFTYVNDAYADFLTRQKWAFRWKAMAGDSFGKQGQGV